MIYTDRQEALSRAVERCQGQATPNDEEWLTEVLEMSAGTAPDEVLHYRPFLAAARLLEQKLAAQTLSSADGAVFTGLALPIASLLGLQAAYDAANELEIPPGFEALPPVPPRYQSRSLSRRSAP